MPQIADHVLDLPEQAYINAGTSRLHNINDFSPYDVKDGDLIFVKTNFIVNGTFEREFLSRIPPSRSFNLITGVSSYNLGRDDGDGYKRILNHPAVNKWICTNPPVEESDKIIPIPIGFQEPDRPGGNQIFLESQFRNRKPYSEKEDKIFLPWHNISTNPLRHKLINELASLSFVVVQTEKQSLTEYYDSMNRYKFVIGLEGRGPDIHRNYETLLVGSIPINLKSVITKVFDMHKATAVFLESWECLTNEKFDQLLCEQFPLDKNDDFLLIENHIKNIKNLSTN